jgi:hypothetical protein
VIAFRRTPVVLIAVIVVLFGLVWVFATSTDPLVAMAGLAVTIAVVALAARQYIALGSRS